MPASTTITHCADCQGDPAADCDRCARLRFLERPAADRREARLTAAERQRAAAGEALAQRVARSGTLGAVHADEVVLGTVPSFRASSGTLPLQRRQVFLDRVARLAREARRLRRRSPQRAPEDGFRTARPAVAATLASACAHCGGHCCRGGGDHAHLDVATLRSWFSQHPEASDADAVAAYERRLPAASMERSCVFHTDSGCALPRAMRSDTCNRYLCADLANLAAELEWFPAPVAFISTVRHGELGDAILTDGTTVELVRLTRRRAGDL